ncbi:hypothetical protein S245_013867 [Arachis hypogaea]
MCQLKLLILDDVKAPILCYIPCTLKIFRWRHCPLKILPLTDHQSYELVEIDLPYSEIVELWDGQKVLEKLEYLNLVGCKQLKQTPDLSMAPNLKELDLRECEELDYIHPSLAHHKRLVELNLGYCERLETLGDKLEMSSLERLDLYSCSSLRRLPEFGECMKQLSKIILAYTDIESLTVRADYDDSDGSSREESTLSYDIAHLASLTDLDLSENMFLRVPISIHQLTRLTRLQLWDCSELEVLPELPSSLRELGAGGCYSLAAWNVDEVISKACCGFAESASQDREDFLQMLITGEEIPAWFEHQEEDNGVSVSFPQNCPSIETIALALCFVIEIEEDIYPIMPSVICNGKEFINASLYPFDGSDNLFIVCVNGYYCSKLLCQHNRFQILSPDDDNIDIRVKRCGARWVFKQDMQDFKKRKATLELNMDISHSSASRNKMLVVDSPIYEEEIEPAATAEASICHLASRKSSDPPQLLPPFPLQEVHETYNVEGLMESEALNLFSLEAFNLPKPSEEFLDLSKEVVKEVVKYSGGLPLALQVLGSYLNGRPIVVWHSAIEKIKQFSHSEIIDVLKISFDGLDDMEKNIFLDIACFFKGYEKGNVTRILEGCGYQAELGLHILINRSLVTINKYDQLEMHDLLEEMGKRIVIQESPNDPSKRSRLWCYEDLNSVLAQKKGTEAIQSIVLNSSSEKHLRFEAFSKLKLSKLLILCGVEVEVEPPSDLPCLPSTLKVLHWWRCPLKTLPLAETEHEFAEIELRFSRIEELWLGKKDLENLEKIDLSGCKKLMKLPNLSKAPKLKWVYLSGCESLCAIHVSDLSVDELVTLKMDGCKKLERLECKKHLPSLKEINLDGCLSLEEFSVTSDLLERLDLSNTGIKKLCSSIGRLHKLVWLNLEGLGLENLPDELSSLKSLKELKISSNESINKQKLHVLCSGLQALKILHLKQCDKLCELPDNISFLSQLNELRLDGSSVEKLPASIKGLQELEILSLKNCCKIQSLPELPPLIKEFWADNCTSLESVSTLMSFLGKMKGKDTLISLKKCTKLSEKSVEIIEECAQLIMMNDAFVNASNCYKYNTRVGVCFAGSRVPREFTYRRTESSSITIQLPEPSNCLGFIYCVVLSKGKSNVNIRCQCYSADSRKVGCSGILDGNIISDSADHVYVWYDAFHCRSILENHEVQLRFQFCETTDNGDNLVGLSSVKECGVQPIRISDLDSCLLSQELKKELTLELGKKLGLVLDIMQRYAEVESRFFLALENGWNIEISLMIEYAERLRAMSALLKKESNGVGTQMPNREGDQSGHFHVTF